MNTNLIHNILNASMTLVAGLEMMDWTPFLSPEQAVTVVGVLSLTKIVMNAFRDGITGLWANQPPVEK